MTDYLKASFISSSSGTERQPQNTKIDNQQFRNKFKSRSSTNSQLQKFRSQQICPSIGTDEENQKQDIQSAILESDSDIANHFPDQNSPRLIQVDISPKKIQNKSKSPSKSRSKSPKQVSQQMLLLTLQFDLKYRIIKVPVYLNDTSFTITHRLLSELNVQTTPAIILKTSDVIQATLDSYMTELYDWITFNRLGKVDSILWKAQVHKNKHLLQDLEDSIQADLLSEQLIDPNYVIGKIKIFQQGLLIGEMNVLRNSDPQECVSNFLYASGLHYDEQKFNRLVNEVISIQILNGNETSQKPEQILTNIKVTHDKIVRINARRNENLDKTLLKISVNNKLTPKQTNMVKDQILKKFYM